MHVCRWLLPFVAALAAVPTTAQAQRAAAFSERVRSYVSAEAPVILVRNVRLLDPASRRIQTGQSLLIRDGRIAAIGPGLQSPAGAVVIDGKGRTMMPGLVLVHEHLMSPVKTGVEERDFANPYVPQVLLAYGVTTARTAGSFDLDGDLVLKRQIERGLIPGPDLDLSMFIGGAERPMLTIPRLKDAAAARADVAYWANRGVTSIKLWFGTDPQSAAGAIAEAKARGMNIAGHLCGVRMRTAVELGLETLEHGVWSAVDLLADAPEGRCPMQERITAMLSRLAELDGNSPEIQEILRLLKGRGVAITPTLSVWAYDGICAPAKRATARELALLSRSNEQGKERLCFPGMTAAKKEAAVRTMAEAARAFFRMGGTLLVGTDQGAVAGAGAPDELEAMVAAGVPAMGVLAAATINGARALKRDKDVGSLAIGKRADLILVDGRPDEDITAMRRVTSVFRDGIAYDPDKLRAGAKGTIIN